MNPTSSLIKEVTAEANDSVGSLTVSPIIDAIKKISLYINSEEGRRQLVNRKISIEVKLYDLPPIIHGFLVSDKFLYFEHTEIWDSKIKGGGFPYRRFTLDNDSLISKHYFDVYKSWFIYIWSNKAQTAVKFSPFTD